MDNTQLNYDISDCIVIAEKLEKQLKKLKKRLTTNGLSSSNIKIDIEINKILSESEGKLLKCLDEVKTYDLYERNEQATKADDTFNKLKNELKGLTELNQQLDAYKATMIQNGDMMVSSQMQFWGFLSIYMLIAYYFIRSS